MTTVGAFEAKTNLNALLKKVARGETIQITLRGVLVAKLVPASSDEPEDPRTARARGHRSPQPEREDPQTRPAGAVFIG